MVQAENELVTILSILVGMVHLLSDICFCISSYVDQQLHSLDCQHFVHYISLVLFTFLRTPLLEIMRRSAFKSPLFYPSS
jgi:hypothetical protein